MSHEGRTTCNRDCPDSCGVVVSVEDGRAVAHRGDPSHPITRGFLCHRGNHYLERVYHAERIVHPLRRTASGGWERLSWDDALDLVASRMSALRQTLGPRSVLFVSYSGIHTWVARAMGRVFWSSFGGGTFLRGGLSVEASIAAQHADFGADGTHAPEDLANAAGFAAWGKNIAVTRPHAVPFVSRARRKGAPLFVIDPIPSALARSADRHLALRPGTDGLLALGVGRMLVERGAIDQRFVEQHVSGFEAWRRLILSNPLAQIARATDVPEAAIAALADLYATTKPLATLIGLGPSYWRHGGAGVRLVDALAAVTGNLGMPGGGAQTDISSDPGLNLSLLSALPKGDSRAILLPRLGDEILAAKDPPIRMAFVAGANPAATAPDTHRVIAGLRALEFVVVVDQFHTATSAVADVVLPCTTYLEMDDLVSAYGHHWLGLTQKVIEPVGESRTDGEIFQGLAARLGLGDALAGTPDEWMARLLEGTGLDLSRLRQGAALRPGAVAVPFADRRFATPSGKVELLGQFPVEAAAAPLATGELHLVATKTLKMVNAQMQPEDLPDEPVARVHPEALARFGLEDGGQAVLSSGVGAVTVRLKADDSLRRDILVLNPARWRGDASGVNQLREAALTDLGEGAAMHQTRVRLAPPLPPGHSVPGR